MSSEDFKISELRKFLPELKPVFDVLELDHDVVTAAMRRRGKNFGRGRNTSGNGYSVEERYNEKWSLSDISLDKFKKDVVVYEDKKSTYDVGNEWFGYYSEGRRHIFVFVKYLTEKKRNGEVNHWRIMAQFHFQRRGYMGENYYCYRSYFHGSKNNSRDAKEQFSVVKSPIQGVTKYTFGMGGDAKPKTVGLLNHSW